jgi:alpha-1,3-rhamnosyl/mannosyltransferase
VDEQGTGMQRFGSEMILALLRNGLPSRIILGEVQGRPQWLEGVPHEVLIGPRASRRVPRPLAAVARLLWLQFLLPLKARRTGTVLTLADSDLATFPMFRQVAVVHDLTQARELRQHRSRARNARIRMWKTALHRSDRVIAISEATKRDLVESFGVDPERVEVVYEGFDPAVFYPRKGEPAAPPYLLYAGTLAPNKNLPFLLRVFCRLRDAGFGVELQLAGRYTPERAAEMLGPVPEQHRAAVRMIGFVSDEELAERMRGCTAFVFPSLSEGFGLAPVEAMACGAPVVSSEATSLKEVVGEGGVLLSPEDEQAWVDALTRVLGSREHRLDLSERALRRSAVFSWDRAAEAYRGIIEGRSARPA